MLVIRAIERMGLRGTLAFGAALFSVNAYVFWTVSVKTRDREMKKSLELDMKQQRHSRQAGHQPPEALPG